MSSAQLTNVQHTHGQICIEYIETHAKAKENQKWSRQSVTINSEQSYNSQINHWTRTYKHTHRHTHTPTIDWCHQPTEAGKNCASTTIECGCDTLVVHLCIILTHKFECFSNEKKMLSINVWSVLQQELNEITIAGWKQQKKVVAIVSRQWLATTRITG